jgi:hypothetical protein
VKPLSLIPCSPIRKSTILSPIPLGFKQERSYNTEEKMEIHTSTTRMKIATSVKAVPFTDSCAEGNKKKDA